jgi:hypothetical protein
MLKPMRTSAAVPCSSQAEKKASARLGKYRAKAAAMVHKATGDPEQVCKDGLIVRQALKPARQRANSTALKKDE